MLSDERIEIAERMRGQFDVCECVGHTYINGTIFGMQVCARDEIDLRNGMRHLADLIDPTCEMDDWGVCDGRRDQKFSGLYKEVVPRFERWAAVRPEEAEEEKEETVAKETEGAAKAQERPDRLWSLVFRRGSTSRVMMAFADESRAYDMADLNTKALEVAGADGEWTVDELEVRW